MTECKDRLRAAMRRRGPVMCALLMVSLLLILGRVTAQEGSEEAAARETAPGEWRNVARVLVVGDIHGALQPLLDILQAADVIDQQGNWTGGQAHLVSLGDLIDRGAQSRAVLDLLMRLQKQALSAGGRVHVLLGNHEVMNLTGELQDVSTAEMDSYGGLRGHAELFAPTGVYGSWLLTLPSILIINDSLFVHGGVSGLVSGKSVAQINNLTGNSVRSLLTGAAAARAYLAGLAEVAPYETSTPDDNDSENDNDATQDLFSLAEEIANLDTQPADPDLIAFINAGRQGLLAGEGPHWYRGNAACHALLEAPDLTRILSEFGVRRVVVGHTPTPGRWIRSRLNGQVIAVDTGMLAEVYRGRPLLLDLSGGQVSVIDITGARSQPHTEYPDPQQLSRVEALLRDGEITAVETMQDDVSQLTLAGGSTARFTAMGNKRRQRELAAYRLDRLLGLHMVPVTVSRRVNDRDGVVQLITPGQQRGQWLSEQQRQEGGYRRPNYCRQGGDYELVSAFDSLIGKRDRNMQTIQYDIPSWAIRLVDNGSAFPGDGRLNQYAAEPVLPAAFAERLEQLQQPQLDTLLGELLSTRQIKAILKRRDGILDWTTR